jgi:hypothetical protein
MIRHVALVAPALILILISPFSHAAPITYVASLSGPNESPPNSSPGTGFAEVATIPSYAPCMSV